MDFALTQLSRVADLIMVDNGPRGLELDVPGLSEFGEQLRHECERRSMCRTGQVP
jgi:hypothetical protein